MTKVGILSFLFCLLSFVGQLSAKEKIQLYFANDSMNGLKFSDAYETHNMGLIYQSDEYYLKLDLGIVSPDMYVYRNEYRDANRSFGELISLEFGKPYNNKNDVWLYLRGKSTGKFGVDKLQDFAHQILNLQQVNSVNDLVRMPEDAWFGIGLRREFELSLEGLQKVRLNMDGFLGSDTAFLSAKLTKTFHQPLLVYDVSVGGRYVAYDQVVSAPPINAKERRIIPELSFGVSYDNDTYSIFLRDTFSLPSIKADNSMFGVFSAGISYAF